MLPQVFAREVPSSLPCQDTKFRIRPNHLLGHPLPDSVCVRLWTAVLGPQKWDGNLGCTCKKLDEGASNKVLPIHPILRNHRVDVEDLVSSQSVRQSRLCSASYRGWSRDWLQWPTEKCLRLRWLFGRKVSPTRLVLEQE